MGNEAAEEAIAPEEKVEDALGAFHFFLPTRSASILEALS
jgi:hypothetical protein